MKLASMVKINFRQIVLLSSIFFIAVRVFGQDFNEHKKYWFYRTKLNNDFVKVGCTFGPYTGESLPFNQRARYATDDHFRSAEMATGDEISTLGIYIGVLATEYRLLANNNQDTRKVRHELFCALNAANRLDYYAEPTLFASTCSEALNGFLMRDDIPGNFVLSNYQHFNYNNTWNGTFDGSGNPISYQTDFGFASLAQQGVFKTFSNYQDYVDVSHYSDKTDIRMSQDHVISLLFGLSLVNSLVDHNAYDETNPYYNVTCVTQPYDPGAGASIRTQAQRIVDRLVSYVQNHNDWKIEDPCTQIYIGGNAGGNARVYSYALAETGCIASSDNTTSMSICVSCTAPIKSCDTYHNTYSKTLGDASWQADAITPGTTPDVAVQTAELSAACNCIYNDVAATVIDEIVKVLTKVWKWLGWFVGWVLTWVDQLIQHFIPETIYNGTNDGMRANVNQWDLDYAPFARAVIHNDYPSVNKPENHYDMPGLLDQAPCEGPWNLTKFFPDNVNPSSISDWWPGNGEWSSDTRVEHPERRKEGAKTTFPVGNHPYYDVIDAEYNGLDYMLYHNLWFLYKTKFMGAGDDAQDMSDRIVSFSLPLGNNGTSTSPMELDAFETIIANNSIAANAVVTYRAGKWIHHTSNFHVAAGAVFHEYVKPFHCDVNGNYSRQMAANDSSKKHGPADYIACDMGYVKTHHIQTEGQVANFAPPKPAQVDNSGPVKEFFTKSTPSYQQALTNAIVKTAIEDNELNILPNPSNGIFKVKLPSSNKSSVMQVWIYNTAGDVVLQKDNLKKWPETENIDLTEYGAGSYLIRILSEDGKNYTRKIIVK